MGNSTNGLKKLLDDQLKLHNQKGFIEKDPISIPHRFSKKQDIEIAGFFASIFAWGNRTTIINKCNELMLLMDHSPYQFITQHRELDLKRFLDFKHRTFKATDLLHFISVLRHHYENDSSAEPTLETAFSKGLNRKDETVENALMSFHDFFSVWRIVRVEPKNTSPLPPTILPAKDSTCFSVGWCVTTMQEWILVSGKISNHINWFVRSMYMYNALHLTSN